MKHLLHLLLLQILMAPNALADGLSSLSCKVSELVEHQKQYNEEVCSGGNRLGGTDVISSDGKSGRFDKDSKFRGFLEPKRDK